MDEDGDRRALDRLRRRLQALFDGILDEPVPPRILDLVQARGRRSNGASPAGRRRAEDGKGCSDDEA